MVMNPLDPLRRDAERIRRVVRETKERIRGRRPALVFALEQAKAKYDRGLLLKQDVITDLLGVIENDKELLDVERIVDTW